MTLSGIISRVRSITSVAGLSRLIATIQWLTICSREILSTEMPLKEFHPTETVASEQTAHRVTAEIQAAAAATDVTSVRVLCVLTVVANASAVTLFPAVEVR